MASRVKIDPSRTVTDDDIAAIGTAIASTLREEMRELRYDVAQQMRMRDMKPVLPWPSDVESELYVLSAMWEGDTAPKWLQSQHFSSTFHAHVFTALASIDRKIGDAAEMFDVKRYLCSRGWKPSDTLSDDLEAISIWPYQTVDRPARRVYLLAQRRSAIVTIARCTAALHEPNCDAVSIARDLRAAADVLDQRGREGTTTVASSSSSVHTTGSRR
jgi:hypothetical protein